MIDESVAHDADVLCRELERYPELGPQVERLLECAENASEEEIDRTRELIATALDERSGPDDDGCVRLAASSPLMRAALGVLANVLTIRARRA